jgi:hypothetical protein
MGGFILGFAALLAGEEWAAFVRIWGPIALSILVGGDAAGDLIELGGLIASYNLRYKAWEAEKEAWMESRGVLTFRAESVTEKLVFDPSWPVMTKAEFEKQLGLLNGDRATLADPEKLKKFIHSQDRNLPSRTTLKRFRTLAGN